MKHIFYVPASYAALIYAILSCVGLLLPLFIGSVMHPIELLTTSCGKDHYEFWPSISTTVGDMLPERQVWRFCFVLCSPFRIGASISLFSVFWQKACGGMTELHASRTSIKQLMDSSAFLILFMFWSDVWRLLCASAWTMIASSESLAYHNLGFIFYVVLCFTLQLTMVRLVGRNRQNRGLYPTPRDGTTSYRLKLMCMIGETVAALGVGFFYVRHRRTCAPGSYSLSTMCEWCFASCNIFFDATAWYELKTEGWWLSGSPSFYIQRWREPSQSKDFPSDGGIKGLMHSKGRDTTTGVAIASLEDQQDVAPLPTAPHSCSSGERFLSDDVCLHRFTFCSPPSRLTMWLCDIYWCYLFFETIVLAVEHMYFMPLVAMSLSWEMVLAFTFASPCLLRLRSFRRWATGPCYGARTFLRPSEAPLGTNGRSAPMYLLFYSASIFSHLHLLVVTKPRLKIVVVAVGSLFVSLATFCRLLYIPLDSIKQSHENSEDSRRTLYCFPLGLVLSMLLRILYVSIDPVFVEASYAGPFGIVLGITFVTCLYRHAMFGNAHKRAASIVAEGNLGASIGNGIHENLEWSSNSPDNVANHASLQEETDSNTLVALGLSYTPPSEALLGLLFGLLTGLSLTFFTCANYIPRLLAVDPFPASVMVVCVFFSGLHYSMDVLPISPAVTSNTSARQGSVRYLLRKVFRGSWSRFGCALVGSCMLMLYGTRQTNFTYEKPHENYPVTYSTPKEHVTVSNWGVQETFRGSKNVAFAGGLLMTFCIAVLYPVVMEVCFVHQRARHISHTLAGQMKGLPHHTEAYLFASFEFVWAATVSGFVFAYALCIAYPFVPMAEVLREKTSTLILLHVTATFVIAWLAVRRIRHTKNFLCSDTRVARKERSIQFMVVIIVVVAIVWTVVGRVSLQPDDVSYPAGKQTAIEHQTEVLDLHRILVGLWRDMNSATDPLLPPYDVTYHRAKFNHLMSGIESKLTSPKNRTLEFPSFSLNHLSLSESRDVWDAAKAMTFFTGMIWTVHFGLDNTNVDSFGRLVKQAKATGAGVVGLLESDSMHLINGNRDMVEYLSYHMGYRYTDYGPTALDNTFGCALISRYPILSVRRYVMPSPLGELACVIHARLDVFGVSIHTYVGHFGNTEHWADGLLQSQFLGQLVKSNPGPSLWLGYLVTHPGLKDRYHEYTHPTEPGMFRDTALELYLRRPWVRLHERGGYDEVPPEPVLDRPKEGADFNTEYKLNFVRDLERDASVDHSFRPTPTGKSLRHFYYNNTNRYATCHPRFEFVDRYCQYSLYKTGASRDERPEDVSKLQKYEIELFDWWRIINRGVEKLSDTEIQVTQLMFKRRDE